MTLSNKALITVRRLLAVMTVFSVLVELVLFFTLENLVGCVMMIVAYILFVNFVLKEKYIINYPFSFFAMFAMFAYRYIPVIGTLFSNRPVSYGMETPIRTFVLETFFYSLSVLIFCLACRKGFCKSTLKRIHYTFKLYDYPNNFTIWLIGLVGVLARVYIYVGHNSNGIMSTIMGLMYAPVLLFFPCFDMSEKSNISFNKPDVWFYIIFITILNLGSNSRADIISPFIIILALMVIYIVKTRKKITSIISWKKMIVLLILSVVIMSGIQRISDAMLAVRNIRSDVSITRLISLTADGMFGNNEKIQLEVDENNDTYSHGWTETYIDNFILNRFGNIRITDETLYLGDSINNNDREKLLQDLGKRLICILPQPVINLLFDNINKADYMYSRGDYLYYISGHGTKYSLGGYRVTSLLADGLATFDFLFWPIITILLYLMFKLLNSLVWMNQCGQLIYSVYGLLSLYDYIAMMSNSNGVYSIISFVIRVFWEGSLVLVIVKQVF